MLMVMVSLMNVMLAKATPVWSHLIQREKEQAMIFRGLQYAEAIRVFQGRYNQWPQKLQELVEDKGKGRCIRRLWNNPLAGPDGDEGEGWVPMFEGMPDPCAIPQDNGLGDGGFGGQGGAGQNNGPGGRDLARPSGGSPVVQVGNIIGVCSREHPEILKREIQNWQFTAQLIDQSVYGNDTGIFPMNSADIGRPFPGVPNLPNQPGVPGGQPGQQPGGQPGGGGPGAGPANNPNGGRPEVPFGTRPRPTQPTRGDG